MLQKLPVCPTNCRWSECSGNLFENSHYFIWGLYCGEEITHFTFNFLLSGGQLVSDMIDFKLH